VDKAGTLMKKTWRWSYSKCRSKKTNKSKKSQN